jgi:hypothetical protein
MGPLTCRTCSSRCLPRLSTLEEPPFALKHIPDGVGEAITAPIGKALRRLTLASLPQRYGEKIFAAAYRAMQRRAD